jgi:adenine-specific DNA glycosylase
VETELAGLLSPQEPGDFNQALMELGQTLCLPRGPRCSACPLAKWCGAFRSGHPEAPAIRRTSHFLALAAQWNPITSPWPFSAVEQAWR